MRLPEKRRGNNFVRHELRHIGQEIEAVVQVTATPGLIRPRNLPCAETSAD